MILRLSDWENAGIVVIKNDLDHPDDATEIAPPEERIVLDLHVGESVERGAGREGVGQLLRIKPSECLCIETDERILSPETTFGTVCCKHSVAATGLWVANAKVDPNYGTPPLGAAPLWISVINPTSKSIVLGKGDAFCSLFFQKLPNPVAQGDSRCPSSPSWKKRPLRFIVEEFLKHPLFVAVAASFITALLTVYLTVSDDESSLQRGEATLIPDVEVLPEADTDQARPVERDAIEEAVELQTKN